MDNLRYEFCTISSQHHEYKYINNMMINDVILYKQAASSSGRYSWWYDQPDDVLTICCNSRSSQSMKDTVNNLVNYAHVEKISFKFCEHIGSTDANDTYTVYR